MPTHRRGTPSIAWAWAAAWGVATLGMVLSDVYSTPSSGLAAAYILGFMGWAIGAAATIRELRRRSEPSPQAVVLAAIGWTIGAYVGVVVGLSWIETIEPSFFGPILATALGGAIGGACTLPMTRSTTSLATVRTSLIGALSWGASFLLLQVVAFYAGYILMQMTVDPLVPLVGHMWSKAPGWTLPAALGGFMAARVVSARLGQPRHLSALATLALITLALASPAQAQTTSAPEALMDKMTGHWVMTGTIRKAQTTHDVDVDWVLKREYIRIHEVSRDPDPNGGVGYEAWIYLVWDAKKNEYAVMWLDNTAATNFAAEGVGHAKPDGDRIPIRWKDADGGGIHTTFAYDRAKDTWHWTIDNIDASGKSSPFATLALVRKK